MKQNKYDDPNFFAKYSEMPRSVGGLKSAGEWPVFCRLLPDLRGKRVLDLGCGFGWHCQYARRQGARHVVGVDLSEKMLARAKAANDDLAIEYRRCAIEDAGFADGQFELVISSLVLHYVQDFASVCQNVFRWLSTGGSFVFSVEHPMFTARAAQDWCYGPSGERLHWPVDNYRDEGPRHTQWMAGDVIKYHRTLQSYVNTLIHPGFSIASLLEPMPSAEMVAERPEWKDENRRPIFLLVAAVKNPAG